MKYTLWGSCYIDLFKGQGVGSYFIELDGIICRRGFTVKENTTINELNLLALLKGLRHIPDGSDVDIIGISQYVDGVLHKLASWMREDGMIDLKAHSEILKKIWAQMTAKDKIASNYFTSRRSDPMLWTTSQASRQDYREMQEHSIKIGKFPDETDWEVTCKGTLKKSDFLEWKFKTPLTDLAFEKLVMNQAKSITPCPPQLNNVFSIWR